MMLGHCRIGHICRPPSCSFSSSSGPQRYIPKSIGSVPIKKQSESCDRGRTGRCDEELSKAETTWQQDSRQPWISDAVHQSSSKFSRQQRRSVCPESQQHFWNYDNSENGCESATISARSGTRNSGDSDIMSHGLVTSMKGKCHANDAQSTASSGGLPRNLRSNDTGGSCSVKKDEENTMLREKATGVISSGEVTERFAAGAQIASAKTGNISGLSKQSTGIYGTGVRLFSQADDSYLRNDDDPSDEDLKIEDSDEGTSLEDEIKGESKFSHRAYPAQLSTFTKVEGASSTAQEIAKNHALRYLAMRPYTAFQLKKKLLSRNLSQDLVDYALSAVQSCGLQSDLAYAETFARSRWTHSSWGPQRIRLGLKQRGISSDLIDMAIHSVFHEENDYENNIVPNGQFDSELLESTLTDMSKSAMDRLMMQAEKHWNRGKNITKDTKVRRIIHWLQYRGFNGKVIKAVVNTLLAQVEK